MPSGTPLGIELILPDYAGVLDAALVLTIDPAYFRLTGGIERWLYRLVRKHGGKQEHGWQFDFRTCTANRAAWRATTSPADLRALVARQSLPGYVLGIERMPDDGTAADLPARAAYGTGITAESLWTDSCYQAYGVSCYQATTSCYQEYGSAAKPASAGFGPLTSLT
jgi:plasmid replication initiation protein